ncbi:hypothetical protein L2E82_51978 [Cichorium intybus]|nr:hypothetical protein L2E82_51978 [Cichorium intybus]
MMAKPVSDFKNHLGPLLTLASRIPHSAPSIPRSTRHKGRKFKSKVRNKHPCINNFNTTDYFISGFLTYYIGQRANYDSAIARNLKTSLPTLDPLLDGIEKFDDDDILKQPWGVVFIGKISTKA